ncbi:MAG: DUF4174 domain-containing protein [Chitinophagaceae bacterium]
MTANVMGQFSSFRQLLIFGSEENMMLGEQQLNLLNKSSVGVKERSLKITVVEKKSRLYQKNKVDPNQFTVILKGKDGYEKYRTNKVLEIDQLFSIIDAMPMRKNEMKKN